jgi:CIC family chloride channel protein
MIMLVLETTGDFSTSIGVMVGVITTSVAVRQWFGYSFATWRFHIRGLPIVSPEDVGWINDLNVGRLMDLNPPCIAATTSIAELVKTYPAGSVRHVFAVDGEGALRGEVDIAEAMALSPDDARGKKAGDLAHHAMLFLMPHESIRQALQRFRDAAIETLPVVNNGHERRVVGSLTEAFALRRYAQELERRKGLETDSAGIYSPNNS